MHQDDTRGLTESLKSKGSDIHQDRGELGGCTKVNVVTLLASHLCHQRTLDAAAPSRMSSECSLLLCATHSRGRTLAGTWLSSSGYTPMFSLLGVLKKEALEVRASLAASGALSPTRAPRARCLQVDMGEGDAASPLGY